MPPMIILSEAVRLEFEYSLACSRPRRPGVLRHQRSIATYPGAATSYTPSLNATSTSSATSTTRGTPPPTACSVWNGSATSAIGSFSAATTDSASLESDASIRPAVTTTSVGDVQSVFLQGFLSVSVVQSEAHAPFRRTPDHRGSSRSSAPAIRVHDAERAAAVLPSGPPRHDRRLFAEVSRLIYAIITEFYAEAVGRPQLSGLIVTHQSFGDQLWAGRPH